MPPYSVKVTLKLHGRTLTHLCASNAPSAADAVRAVANVYQIIAKPATLRCISHNPPIPGSKRARVFL